MAKILLIDDDAKFRRLVMVALSGLSVEIVQAINLKDATLDLQCGKFDLIILDGWLNDQNGEDWLRSLRNSGNTTDVIFVSGTWRDTESYYRLTNELDVRLIVHKPIAGQIFAEQVRQVLAHLLPSVRLLDAQQDLSTELLNLSVEFFEELPERLEQLAAALKECARGASARPGSFSDALSFAHRLRGTGSTFGQDWVTDIATRIEETLKRIATANEPMNVHIVGDLVDLVTMSLVHYKSVDAPRRSEIKPQAIVVEPHTKLRRILLVDDDVFFTRKVELLLGGEGMVLTTFTDTVRILDLLADIGPDLLILDINLPGVSGFDVCRHLRAHYQWKHLPILMVSADTPWSARNVAVQAGATNYLTKPISNKDLVDSVHSIFSDYQPTPAEITQAVL